METGPPAPLADDRVLELAGTHLAELTGKEWRVQNGPLLKGPGSAGVRVGQRHDDSFRHVDLDFLLNVDREETSLLDCSTGLAADPEEAARQAIAAWADTTASVALEMITQKGKYATHLKPGTPEGFPGWHAIIGGVSTWGFGEDASAKGQWMADKSPWAELAAVIAPGLDRPFLNGVRLFLGQGGDFTDCEVRINGVLHEPSSAALAVMDWPRTEKMSTARVFFSSTPRKPATKGQAPRWGGTHWPPSTDHARAPRCPRTANSQRRAPAAPREHEASAGLEPASNAREHACNP